MRFYLDVASALSAIVAAGFWAYASRRPAPKAFDLRVRADGQLDPSLKEWALTTTRANKRAALAAAVAAALQGVAIFSR